ncbi:MAG: metallophosphoesterase family protein [Rhodocyclaceae bacterium]|nr:metallophosphoesterase family protein [Rhodocyclaceae bacterium]
MRIYTVNDLHIEMSNWMPTPSTGAAADLVVLAGDIGRHTHGLEWARTAFAGKRIVYVAGNHEFYGAEYHGMRRELRRTARALEIDLLENDAVVIDGVRILGCTLWTDFRLYGNEFEAMGYARRRMNDFLQIRFEGSPTVAFRPEDSAVLHRHSRAWLEARLAEPFVGKTVVVTHHAPSLASIDDQWKKGLLTAAFASHLDPLVARADLWLHGHTHGFADHMVGGCRVVCNPRGYVRDGRALERTGWNPELVLEV